MWVLCVPGAAVGAGDRAVSKTGEVRSRGALRSVSNGQED